MITFFFFSNYFNLGNYLNCINLYNQYYKINTFLIIKLLNPLIQWELKLIVNILVWNLTNFLLDPLWFTLLKKKNGILKLTADVKEKMRTQIPPNDLRSKVLKPFPKLSNFISCATILSYYGYILWLLSWSVDPSSAIVQVGW